MLRVRYFIKNRKLLGISVRILFFRPKVHIFQNTGAPRLVHYRYEVANRGHIPEPRLTS